MIGSIKEELEPMHRQHETQVELYPRIEREREEREQEEREEAEFRERIAQIRADCERHTEEFRQAVEQVQQLIRDERLNRARLEEESEDEDEDEDDVWPQRSSVIAPDIQRLLVSCMCRHAHGILNCEYNIPASLQ